MTLPPEQGRGKAEGSETEVWVMWLGGCSLGQIVERFGGSVYDYTWLTRTAAPSPPEDDPNAGVAR